MMVETQRITESEKHGTGVRADAERDREPLLCARTCVYRVACAGYVHAAIEL